MLIDGATPMLALDTESSLRIEHAAVLEIECLSGVLWMTREGDICDRFIGPGERFSPSGRGVTLITALERSLVRVIERPAARARPIWLGWLRRRPVVRRLYAAPAQALPGLAS
jgi:hypothetical protein